MNNILLAMSAGEKLALGGSTFLIGLVMVFTVLVIIIGIVELVHYVVAKTSKKSKKVDAEPKAVATTTQIAPVASNDEEVVAAITAAINMYYDCQSASTGKSVKFRVRSIKEIR